MNNILEFNHVPPHRTYGTGGCPVAAASSTKEYVAGKPEKQSLDDSFLRGCRNRALMLRKHSDNAAMLEAALLGMGLEKIEPRAGDVYVPEEHCPIKAGGTRPVIKACTACGWKYENFIVLRAAVSLKEDG